MLNLTGFRFNVLKVAQNFFYERVFCEKCRLVSDPANQCCGAAPAFPILAAPASAPAFPILAALASAPAFPTLVAPAPATAANFKFSSKIKLFYLFLVREVITILF